MIDAIVTGAKGFIGKALCSSLSEKGWEILPLSRSDGDVASAQTWQSLPPARIVFHLAGRSFVPDSWPEMPEFVNTNVTGTSRALAYCKAHGAHLVFASGYVYGIPKRLPIREVDPTLPNNPYALSKILAEQICNFWVSHQGVTATALRIFNVFGPGQRKEFLIPTVVHQIRTGKEIRVLDFAPRRDYVYLTDVISALIKASKFRESRFHAINIGSGQSLSVAEVVDRIQSVTGSRLPSFTDAFERCQEIPDVVADITLAKKLLGWTPTLTFEAGVAQLLKK